MNKQILLDAANELEEFIDGCDEDKQTTLLFAHAKNTLMHLEDVLECLDED